MPLLNYKKEFAPWVEIGLKAPDHPKAKTQTIRARRKDCRNPKPGQTLYHYTGLRTAYTRKLGESVCKSSETISIESMVDVVVGIDSLSFYEIEALGIQDGFESGYEFLEFFKKVHGSSFLRVFNQVVMRRKKAAAFQPTR